MKRVGGWALSGCLVCTMAGPGVAQQPTFERTGPSLAIYLGGAAYSDFQRRQSVVPDGGSISGEEAVERRLAAESSATFGAAASYWADRNWGLRLHLSYAPSRFEVKTDALSGDRPAIGTGPEAAGLGIWMYDADLLFGLPIRFRRFSPYVLLGGGAITYQVSQEESAVLPEEAAVDFEKGGSRTEVAGVVGIGALVPLRTPDLALSFELSDHIAGTPLRQLREEPAEGEAARDDASRTVKVTNNVRFVVGFVFGFGKGR